MVTGYLLIKEPGYFVHQYNLKMKNMVSTSFVRRPDTWPVVACERMNIINTRSRTSLSWAAFTSSCSPC